ncbi:calcium-binding protein, partial [Halorubrum alkaliphilum]
RIITNLCCQFIQAKLCAFYEIAAKSVRAKHVRMTDEVVSNREMFVLVEWMDREFGVPLSQLEVLDVDSDTRQAVDDWHYWNGNGGRLG